MKSKRYINIELNKNDKVNFTYNSKGQVRITMTYFLDMIREHSLNYLKSLNDLHFNKKSFLIDEDYIINVMKREIELFSKDETYKVPTVFQNNILKDHAISIIQELKCYKLNQVLNQEEIRNTVNKNKTYFQWLTGK